MKRLIAIILIALLIPTPIAEAKTNKPKLLKSKMTVSCQYKTCKKSMYKG